MTDISQILQQADVPFRSLFGVPIHAATMEQVLDISAHVVRDRSRLMIGMVNAAKLVNMKRDPLLFGAVTNSDLILPDGASVVIAGRLLRQRLPQRIPGIDLFENLLRLGDVHRWSVYLLGATPEVIGSVVTEIGERYPSLEIAGYRDGYFTDEEGEAVAQEIRDSKADILFIGITSPKKELFLAKWGRTLDVRICHGVGGSFDVMAGKVRRAPMLWQRLGMEWAFRVVQEPRRMWKRYLVTNTKFVVGLVREMFSPTPLRIRPSGVSVARQ